MISKNSKKEKFLKQFPLPSLTDNNSNIGNRSKFNFSYFVNSDPAGQDFKDWSHNDLIKLMAKLKEYSRLSLSELKNQKIGSGKHKSNIFVVYGGFPKNSEFKEPKHIPVDVEWARIRLEQDDRLIGFVIPEEIGKVPEYGLDLNTFYLVFLDKYHRFYKMK
jgi:hypothetical protein